MREPAPLRRLLGLPLFPSWGAVGSSLVRSDPLQEPGGGLPRSPLRGVHDRGGEWLLGGGETLLEIRRLEAVHEFPVPAKGVGDRADDDER